MSTQRCTLLALAVPLLWACGVTEPEMPEIRLEGRVTNRLTGEPVADATIALQHRESDGDWVLSHSRLETDATVQSDTDGRFNLTFATAECYWYAMEVTASGFRPFTRDEVSCEHPIRGISVSLQPGVCRYVSVMECEWIVPIGLDQLRPAPDAIIVQNDPSIGCPAHDTRGYGFRIDFAWRPTPGVAALSGYRLVARHESAINPMIDVRIWDATEHTEVRCNTFTTDQYLDGWSWFGEAFDAKHDPITRSEARVFSFAPCRLDDGRPCRAN